MTVPAGGPPSTAGAIPFNGWLLYPSLTVFSQYSDNYFLSPPPKISAVGFGVTPSLIATWSDGINTTTLNGHFQGRDYPTASEINATDGEATFTQTYAPLRDLSFTFCRRLYPPNDRVQLKQLDSRPNNNAGNHRISKR